jgi:hypothetical protein
MNTDPRIDRYQESIVQARVLREVYAAAGLDACAKVLDHEIDLLRATIAKLQAEHVRRLIAGRKQKPEAE